MAGVHKVHLEPIVDHLVGLATDLSRIQKWLLGLVELPDLHRNLLPSVGVFR